MSRTCMLEEGVCVLNFLFVASFFFPPTSPSGRWRCRRHRRQERKRDRFKTMAVSAGSERVSCASAPGKVILFGEHAVVYGQSAVACSLSDLRVRVKVTSTQTQRVSISMPDLTIPLHVTLEAGVMCTFSLNEPPTKDDAASIQRILHNALPSLDDISVSALLPVVYLLNKLTRSIFTSGMEVKAISQDLPVGAGLGSSAAFSVALAAALFQLTLDVPRLGKPSPEQLDAINRYAFYSEILLHGTPSGIDNAVSSYGGAIVYTKEEGKVSMENLTMPPLNMILTHTHVPRSTKALVAGVRAMYDKHTEVVQGMLVAMGAIAREFREMMTADDFQSKGDELLTLVRTNQHLLRAVGVSHPSLDYICGVVDDVGNGAAATKLTGAGGGGCAMSLLRPNAESTLSRKIQVALEKSSKRHPWSLSCLTSTVGGEGVLWTDPNSFDEETTNKRLQL